MSTMATTTQLEPPRSAESFELHDFRGSPGQDRRLSGDSPIDAPRGTEESQGGLDGATVLKLIAAGFSFFVSGVNDGSIGPLIPYIIREYELSTAVVSVVYGANFLGWFLAAFTNTHLMQVFDLGGLLAFGAAFQIIAHVLRAWKPPFPLFAVTFWLVCLGQAYQDTGCNTYTAGVKAAHRWLAFIHAAYMAGCLIAPFVATPIASAGETSRWYLFYTFPIGIGVANLSLTCYAFRDTIKFGRRKQAPEVVVEGVQGGPEVGSDPRKSPFELTRMALSSRSFWLISLFFFFFLGASITASGWVVEYLVQVRGGDLAQMGYIPAGFNGGCLLGRLVLAEPTYRFGERRMILIYLVLCIGFQLIFWLVPNVIAASVAISVIGFFSGPFFATGISVASKLFPPEVKPTALSFVFVVGQIGGSFFPIITGTVGASSGVGVMQPVLVGLFVGAGLAWVLVPKPKQSTNTALHQE